MFVFIDFFLFFSFFFQVFKDKAITWKILSFMVYCGFKGKGCTWIGELRTLKVYDICYEGINFSICYVENKEPVCKLMQHD